MLFCDNLTFLRLRTSQRCTIFSVCSQSRFFVEGMTPSSDLAINPLRAPCESSSFVLRFPPRHPRIAASVSWDDDLEFDAATPNADRTRRFVRSWKFPYILSAMTIRYHFAKRALFRDSTTTMNLTRKVGRDKISTDHMCERVFGLSSDKVEECAYCYVSLKYRPEIFARKSVCLLLRVCD